MHSDYLDVVYCHDVEFVSAAEVVQAVRELRRIRDADASIRYVGISGYPVEILAELAELVLKETGEALDVVMSYANYNLQNTRLATKALTRLRAAGVDVVPNASILGMGLLRGQDVFDWHPAPKGLRDATQRASEVLREQRNEKLESLATRYGLESWIREGSEVGVYGHPLEATDGSAAKLSDGKRRLGVTVVGVSNVQEVDEFVAIYRKVLDDVVYSGESLTARSVETTELAGLVRSILGPEWVDYAWASPWEGYVNTLSEEHYQLLREQTSTATTDKTGEVAVSATEVRDVAA